VSGEAFAVESDDLGLAMISAIGGWLMVNLTEATKSENSKLSSVGRLELRLSSYDPSKRSSSATREHDWSRLSFRRDVALVGVPNITPPPMTRQFSGWDFPGAPSESEVKLDLRGSTP